MEADLDALTVQVAGDENELILGAAACSRRSVPQPKNAAARLREAYPRQFYTRQGREERPGMVSFVYRLPQKETHR